MKNYDFLLLSCDLLMDAYYTILSPEVPAVEALLLTASNI